MRHEDIHEILHKERKQEPDDYPFPTCTKCGERFLGYVGDRFCAECEEKMRIWRDSTIMRMLVE
jgi:hypothetical protein